MNTLGIELSDAGIRVAGDRPVRLLEIDQTAFESPGYALLQKKKVLIGRAAESVAHLQPRKVLNRFWDQLGTEPLEYPAKLARNQAEVAFIHLTQIWEATQRSGDSIVMAVPDHYSRTQLGLLQGMAQELDVRILGYLPLSIASAVKPEPEQFLFYLDIHLHRMELTCLRQAERLHRVDSLTLPGKGLLHWQKKWVETIASEFVHTTRFDPLHRAETEQALYHRLPKIVAELKNGTTAAVEMPAGHSTYRTVIGIEQLLSPNSGSLNELERALKQMAGQQGLAPDSPVVILASHRVGSLPGVLPHLSGKANVRVIELPEGAGALGAIKLWDGGAPVQNGNAAVFRTSKPWPRSEAAAPKGTADAGNAEPQPTHILQNAVAYPIGDNPLFIDCDFHSGRNDVQIHSDPSKAKSCRCVIGKRAERYFVEASDQTHATVNGQPVAGNTALKLGDVIALGVNGDVCIKLIACLQNDET